MNSEHELDFRNLQVDKEDPTVSYNDQLHKYWVKNTNQPCISVTTLIHKFTTFDEHFWSCYKALEALVDSDKFKSVKSNLLDTKKFDEKYLNILDISSDTFTEKRNEILAQWDAKREASCLRGTAIHKEHELEHLSGNTKELQHLGLGGKFVPNTTNVLDIGQQKVYPEMLLSYISDDEDDFRLAGQADLIIVDGTDVYILDYKGLPLDTPILTTTGFKELEELTTKDVIFDKDGNKTNILNISKVHHNPCYKIEFDNGESITCDYEHRWLISFYRGKGKFKDKVMNTKELLEQLNKYKSTKNVYDLPKIRNSRPLNTEERSLPIDPYILGAWLGDGTSMSGSITNVNPDFWAEIEKRGYSIGKDISGKERAEMHTILDIRKKLSEMNLIGNKHLPDEYLLASYSQRLDLLRGLMDTDGYYNPTRKRFVMATTKEWQVECMVKILASLGVKPSVIYAKKYCNGKAFDGWDICFSMSDNPFLIRNQENIDYPKTDKASFRVIKNIYEVSIVETKCLEVDSPSHTFLVGHSLLPTHNTNESIDKKSYFDFKTKKSTMMKYPLNNLQDTNFWHYSMQLSTYAWMIEKKYPGVNIKLLMLIHYDHNGNCTTYECDYLKSDVERMLSYYKKELKHEKFKESRKKIKF